MVFSYATLAAVLLIAKAEGTDDPVIIKQVQMETDMTRALPPVEDMLRHDD